jgi:hypothetical protein
MSRSEQILSAARDLFIMTGAKPSQARVARFLRVSPGVVKQTLYRLRERGDKESDALFASKVANSTQGYFYEQRIRPGRRPYLSKRVVAGLRSIVAKHAVSDETLEAYQYLVALIAWSERNTAESIERRCAE